MDIKMENNNTRELVTGISVEKGVISVIDPNGDTKMFRHPLIGGMTPEEVKERIEKGELAENLFDFDAFPNNWEIETEEPEITGDLATTIDSK